MDLGRVELNPLEQEKALLLQEEDLVDDPLKLAYDLFVHCVHG